MLAEPLQISRLLKVEPASLNDRLIALALLPLPMLVCGAIIWALGGAFTYGVVFSSFMYWCLFFLLTVLTMRAFISREFRLRWTGQENFSLLLIILGAYYTKLGWLGFISFFAFFGLAGALEGKVITFEGVSAE